MKALLSLAGALPALLAVSTAWAAGNPVTVTESAGQLVISVAWSAPKGIETARDGRDLLIRFPHQVDGAPFLALPARAMGWVANVETGYDSVLLKAARNVAFDLTTRPGAILISLRPAAAKAGAAEDDRHEAARADLLLAQALIEDGAFSRARGILQDLLARDPEQAEALTMLADLETRTGNWPRAVTLYNRALALRPTQLVAEAKSALLNQYGQSVGTEFKFVNQEHSNTQRSLISHGRVLLDDGDVLGFNHEIRKTWASQGTAPATGDPAYRHAFYNRGELYGTHLRDDGQEVTASLYGGDDTIGAGLATGLQLGDGRGNATLIYHQPYWETLDSVASSGVMDRLKLQYKRELANLDLALEAGGGVSQYTINKDASPSRASSANAALRFRPPVREGSLSIGYVLDAEYAFASSSWNNPASAPATVPTSIDSREFHTAELGYSRNLGDYFSTETTLTYSYDRISDGAGPGATVGLSYRPSPPVDVGMRCGWSLISATTAGAGGKVTWSSAYVTAHF